MKRKGICALALAGVLLMGQTTGAAAWSGYPEKTHLPVDYADMVYTGFDDDALQEVISRLLELDAAGALDTDTPAVRAEVSQLYDQLLREYDHLETQYYLIELRYDADVTDPWAAAESSDFADRFNAAQDQCWSALALLAGSAYADVLERDADWEAVWSMGNYIPMTDEEARLYRREEELTKAYDQAMARDYTVTYQGREWTLEDLYYDATLSEKKYWELVTQIEKQENEAAGPIFLELVQVRTQLARAAGYNNYAEYAYEAVYNRDYTTREISRVYDEVKEAILPLYLDIQDAAGDDIYGLYDLPVADGEEMLDRVEPYMGQIDPELGETFRFMREHHLYDLEASSTKNYVGYTVPLAEYGSAFIFDCPYGDYQDWSTIIHEFGHFNETFHATQSGLWADFSIDVGEMHSQGLEVLFLAYADDLFDSYGKGFTWNTLSNMAESVLDGCLYDEFQMAVYQDPDMTLEEVNRLFGELARAYGYTDVGEEAYFWVEVSHNFHDPMYYISYATSALSALDLYLLSLEDRDRAVDIYLELSALSMGLPYREAVGEVALDDIFLPGTITRLAEGVRARLEAAYSGGGAPSEDKKPAGAQDSSGVPVLFLVGVALTVVGMACLAGAVVLVCKSKKGAKAGKGDPMGEKNKDPWE